MLMLFLVALLLLTAAAMLVGRRARVQPVVVPVRADRPTRR